ncbi:AzlC family ABC transporter permease [Caldanaerobius polysaccharolyticus]|uniref:AzlC family ABC transporter permease n=1 Tax=Caldanaerobius polysaccharolyticus TaxID=44256 RepID=UPI00047C5CD4|nr:AzlC family ABC transporter permease [Caldanaerobius polysaccharolyticus]
MSPKKLDLSGLKSASPIIIGYLPLGFAYGVVGIKSGLSIADVIIFSILCYAGSAQFIGVNLWALGADALSMIATIFIVNLRHLLYSTSLSQYFKNINTVHIPVLSFFITDETYAVSITDFNNGVKAKKSYLYQLFIASYLSWVFSSALGAVLGSKIGNNLDLGLDFALPAMYIALLFMQLNNFKKAVIGLLAGLLSLWLYFLMPGNLNVILAAIIGSLLGVLLNES